MRRALPVLGALAALWAAPAAQADDVIQAAPPQRFVNPNLTIDQGERVTFQNNDVEAHDVTSKGMAADGSRLFKTPFVSGGQSAQVAGAEFLTAGSYGFFCSIHPQMEGTLTVTTAGTPAPRPTDRTAPRISLRILDSRLSRVRRRRALRARVTTSERATVTLTARVGRTRVATGRVELSAAGSKTARLRLTRAGRRKLAGLRRARISLRASGKDPAGNVGRSSTRRTLRR